MAPFGTNFSRLILFLLVLSTSAFATEVDEKGYYELGGEEQYVEIKGADRNNPLLLILHGGPGWPQTPSLRAFNSEISKDFTMIIWEQRGAGLSYMKNPAPKGMTLKQFIADTDQLTDLMLKKFGKKKLYLAGYSWGSVLGLTYAKKYPKKLHAYIGIAQLINKKRGMKYSQSWLRQKAEAANDAEAIAVLDKLKNPKKEFCATSSACFMKQYQLISKYRGHVYDIKIGDEIVERTAKYQDYKDYDWMKPYNYSAPKLEQALYEFDAAKIKRLKVPVYFFLGRHDHNVPAVLAADYLSKLKAPKKTLIWMEKSGHALMEEEAEKFNRLIVSEVLDKK